MLQYLQGTDHLTLFDHGTAAVRTRFAAAPPGAIGISAVTVEEYLRGRLAALARHRNRPLEVPAYARLVASLQLFALFPVVSFDQACASEYQRLRALRLRIGSQDLRIAAIARVHGLIVVTRNRRDFGRIPGLALEDWSV